MDYCVNPVSKQLEGKKGKGGKSDKLQEETQPNKQERQTHSQKLEGMGLGVQPSGRALAQLRQVLGLTSSTTKGEKEKNKRGEMERKRGGSIRYQLSVVYCVRK